MLSDCVIHPRRNKGEATVPKLGILAVNPADRTGFAGLAGRFGLRPQPLFHAQLHRNERFFIAGPAVGAPMATLCLEKLIALGARRIVVYGWCGSLHPSLRIGNLFVPSWGLSEEGTSPHYQTEDAFEGDDLRQRLVEVLSASGHQPTVGRIWTTDAVYRETRSKVERYSAEGIMAVDMEYTALRAVAAFRRVGLAAVMLVSDELFHRQWVPSMQHKRFRAASLQVLGHLCHLLHCGVIE